MVPGRGPRLGKDREYLTLALLGPLGPYWFYVIIALLLCIGFGLMTVLAWFYAEQRATLAVRATPTAFPYNPRIAVEPRSGPPGVPLQVNGQDWPAGDVVFVSLEAPFAAAKRDFAYSGAVVGDDGNFHVSFNFPEDAQWADAGAVKVVAWAEQSGTKSVTIFQVEPPAYAALSTPAADTVFTAQAVVTPQAADERVSIAAFVPEPTATALPALPATHWYGEYFNNPTLSGSPVIFRDDRELDFDWDGGSPDGATAPDHFSVRWSRYLQFSAGVYRFFVQADDGVRLWIDDRVVIDQWHQAAATTYVADTYLWDGPHLVRLDYYEDVDQASVRLWWERLEVFPDWKGEYFNNTDLQGEPAQVRNDPDVRFVWGNEPPMQGIHARDFSVRWTRRATFARGRYRFYVNANTGMRVWLDSTLALDFWQNAGAGLRTTDLSLDDGEYAVRVEYFNSGGNARAEFHWEQLAVTSPPPEAAPQPLVVPTDTAVAPPQSDQVQQTELILKVQSLPDETSAGSVQQMEQEQDTSVAPAATLVTVQDVGGVMLSSSGDVTTNRAPARAELRLEPLAALLGGQITVSGTGWKPGDEVMISVVESAGDLAQAPPFATTQVDDFGEFSVPVVVPDDPKWVDYPELIVLAHNADWTTRLVAPLTILASTPEASPQPTE